MDPFCFEKSILETENELNNLFEFIKKNALELDAYEMEKSIFSRLMRIGLKSMQVYFAEKGTGDVGPELKMEGGIVLRKAPGFLGRDYFSVFGKFKIPRTYYPQEDQNSVMPLDAQANLPQRCYSYLLQEWMDFFSIRDSFGEAVISLETMLGLEVSQSRVEVVNRESSQHYDGFYEAKEVPDPKTEGELQVTSGDGKGVPVIKKEGAKIQARLGKGEKRQKTKEAMVGVSYTVDRNTRTAEEVAGNLIYPEPAREKAEKPRVRAKNIRRMASLERPKEEVMGEIINDAKRRDPERKRPWVVVMDGALCLWALIARLLPDVEWVGVLDIIHVVEYLWDVGNALYGEKSPEAKKWVYDHLLAILEGRVGRVIGGMKQILKKRKDTMRKSQKDALEVAIRYFENHRQWMLYDEYLKEGYPIGSGVVESTCGHTVKSRMSGTGRRWSIDGAESTLLLRSVYTSSDWTEFWNCHRSLERKRLYGGTLNALSVPDDYDERLAA